VLDPFPGPVRPTSQDSRSPLGVGHTPVLTKLAAAPCGTTTTCSASAPVDRDQTATGGLALDDGSATLTTITLIEDVTLMGG